MLRLRCAAVCVVVLGSGCSLQNPAFDEDRLVPDTGVETEESLEGGEDEFGDETMDEASEEEDLPDDPNCSEETLLVSDSIFVLREQGPTCNIEDFPIPAPCEELAFGGFNAFTVFGLEATGNALVPWLAGPAASYALVHLEDSDVRGRDWEVVDAHLFVTAEIFPGAAGELQVRVMNFGEENAWNGDTGGFADFALPGDTTFKYRAYNNIPWEDGDPVVSAADVPLGAADIVGGKLPTLQEIEIELEPKFFEGFLGRELGESNGLMFTSTDPFPSLGVDAQSAVLEFEICELD